jgi:GR25 family glycosyltransferase involved in LPS biosynthesis
MKFYIAHYTPLLERKKHIDEQFEKFGITDYYFVTKYDRESIPSELLNKFSRINNGERSLFLKHIEAFREFINTQDDICVVMEDDCIFDSDFNNKLKQLQAELHGNDNFFVFCADSGNLHTNEEIVPERLIYKATGSRGTGFQVITRKAAKIIVDNFDNSPVINLPIDHWVGVVFFNCIKFCYSEPYLVLQGSVNGLFRQSLHNTPV